MMRISLAIILAASLITPALAADFNFFGRSGDAIEINLSTIPGISPGSTFSSFNTSSFATHTVLPSDSLTAQSFASTGRFWVFANPARNTAALGDTNTAARGYQGTLTGSVLVDGVPKTFSVTVAPGYTGSGAGSVGQSGEALGDATNNPLFVAQQQHRLRYLGFVSQGGAAVAVDGDFGPGTNTALRTFQASFIGGVNTTQANTDGIIGPNTAGWLNAANAPTWGELIDPDPQRPGSFTIGGMIGAFDIYPSPDPGTGARTGLTPQAERFSTNWTHDLIAKGAAKAKVATGRTQRINALSRSDGYASTCCHSTHLVGMDIDLGTDSSTWNYGNGTLSAEENIVVQHAIGFIDAGASGRVIRIITSNDDIYNAIQAARPSTPLYDDASGGHQNHLHIDVGPPTRQTGLVNLAGDFNLDDVVDARDYVIWRENVGSSMTAASYNTWRANFGKTLLGRAAGAGFVDSELFAIAVPEPTAATFVTILLAIASLQRRPKTISRGALAPGFCISRFGQETAG